MSSTRHAPEGAPMSCERYMSSPEYAELRGIPGTAVAAKAQLYNDARKRSLLYFLQSLSLKEGGLRRVAQAIAENVPDSTEKEMARFLVELCIDPKINLTFSKEAHAAPKLDGVIDALRLFQDRYEAKIKSGFVFTTIGREIFETLDHALAIGKRW